MFGVFTCLSPYHTLRSLTLYNSISIAFSVEFTVSTLQCIKKNKVDHVF